jgi:hypothetical protein
MYEVVTRGLTEPIDFCQQSSWERQKKIAYFLDCHPHFILLLLCKKLEFSIVCHDASVLWFSTAVSRSTTDVSRI